MHPYHASASIVDMTALEDRYGAHLTHWRARDEALPRGLPIRERLLLLRGVGPGPERDLFLDPRPQRHLARLLGDPATLPDADAATERIERAVRDGEKICVFGDYDADGVTATAILARGLRQMGADVCYYIPHRVKEGFGMNPSALREIADGGATLVITADCGTSDVEEVELARELGMDVVISDHHSVPARLPSAVAVVNPSREDCRYPFRELTGAGVAYALLRAVAYRMGNGAKVAAADLVQLAAVGTVADVGPLLGENRALLKAGLAVINRRPLPGVAALISCAGLDGCTVTESDLGFRIGPRLNAAGRMKHARTACDLLMCSDLLEATRLARELEELNSHRRDVTERMIETAMEMLGTESAASHNVLTVYSEDWSPALLGIVAGRLSRIHSTPVIAATLYEGAVRASVRSIPGLDIVRALEGCSHLLSGYGGHAQAAAFTTTLDGLDDVQRHLNEVFAGCRREAVLEVDTELEPADLGPELSAALAELAPFGASNEEPVFAFRSLRVRELRRFGRQGDHLSFRIPSAGYPFVEMVAFGRPELYDTLLRMGCVDAVARPLRQRDGTFRPIRFRLEHVFPASAL